jgi:hypothetical protein
VNTTENLISIGCPAVAPQPGNEVIKPIEFPAQRKEWKIVSFRECPTSEKIQQCETPDQAAAYWKSHIANHPYFNPECECLLLRLSSESVNVSSKNCSAMNARRLIIRDI